MDFETLKFAVRTAHRCAGLGILYAGLLGSPAASASHQDGFVWDFEGGSFDSNTWSGDNLSLGSYPSYSGGLFIRSDGSLVHASMDALNPGGSTTPVYLQFDLLLFGDWGGSAFDSFFEFTTAGGTFSTTFSNLTGSSAGSVTMQSYPAPSPGGNFPSGTGSILFEPVEWCAGGTEICEQLLANLLAFRAEFPSAELFASAFSAYRINSQFTLTVDADGCCFDVGVLFASNGESFGIDNFVFSTTPIPEPGTALSFGMGLIGLAYARRSNTRRKV